MKKVQYTFEVQDFCPDKCEAFSPIRALRAEKMYCLYKEQCEQLHRVLEKNAELDRIMAGAAGKTGDPSPACELVRDDRETEAKDGSH